MEILKNIGLVLLGMVLAVGIFCLVVGIAGAVNGISFAQQLADWFGSSAPAIQEPIEEGLETIAKLTL